MTRRTRFAATLTLLTAAAPARADAAPPSNTVLLDLGLHVIGVGYQRTLSSHLAVSASTGLYDAWTATDEVGDVRGAYLRLRPYVFLMGEAAEGLWLSPFVQGALVSSRTAGGEESGLAGAIGAAIGYAFLFDDTVHLSLGGGGQYHAAELFDGFHWHVDATLGYAF